MAPYYYSSTNISADAIDFEIKKRIYHIVIYPLVCLTFLTRIDFCIFRKLISTLSVFA